MFSRSVIGAARFLRMPSTSRLLYYDLGMQADDDGVVEAFSVMRTTGATDDDLRVLVSKGFVTVMNDDLVTHITDWSRNNYIQKDRYRPSAYRELLVQLKIEGIAEAQQTGKDTESIQGVYSSDTQVRLGKDRLGKVKNERERAGARKHPRFLPPTVEEVAEYVKQRGSAVDPQGFVDFYTAKGWLVGKTPMKDWKAACRNAEKWERWAKPAQGGDRDRIKTDADYGEELFFTK